eukprot:m.309652 g.309652  ORF g.309652 m.309652 type:complete len:581 (+) comp47190_c0_seq1:76-1818(+)
MLFSLRIGPSLTMNSGSEQNDNDARLSQAQVPVKMKRKSLKHVSQSDKLEVENRKMEERLRSLREMMVKEKEERELGGGFHWSTGKSGPLASHASDVLKKNKKWGKTGSPLKVKVLADQNADTCKTFLPKAKKNVPKSNGESLQTEQAFTTISQDSQPTVEETGGHGGLLLQGTYNESASAQSFAEALQAWRQGGKGTETQSTAVTSPPGVVTSNCETQAGFDFMSASDMSLASALETATAGGISYMEKLLLKRMKSNPDLLSQPVGPSSPQLEENPQMREALTLSDFDEMEDELARVFAAEQQGIFTGVSQCEKRTDLVVQEVSDSELERSTEMCAECIVEEVDESEEDAETELTVPMALEEVLTEVKKKVKPCVRPPSRKVKPKLSRRKARSSKKLSSEMWAMPVQPYVGLNKFFLAGSEEDSQLDSERQKSEETLEATSSGSSLFSPGKMWNPHQSVVGLSEDKSTSHCDSDSDGDSDERMPVYMRPSSVLQNVPTDGCFGCEDDGEEDREALENLAMELRSMSRLEVGDEEFVSMPIVADAAVASKFLLDPDVFMRDFEELENKLASGDDLDDDSP